jgi:hypothetical protein
MILAWMFVIVPLALYVFGFSVEMFLAFRRLSKTSKGLSYTEVTWEMTHTLLIITLTNFTCLFSRNISELAPTILPGIFLAMGFLTIRSILYVYLFYIRENKTVLSWQDSLFAYSYVGILVGLVLAVAMIIPKFADTKLVANTQFLPFMWPGLLLVLVIGIYPAYKLYCRTKIK